MSAREVIGSAKLILIARVDLRSHLRAKTCSERSLGLAEKPQDIRMQAFAASDLRSLHEFSATLPRFEWGSSRFHLHPHSWLATQRLAALSVDLAACSGEILYLNMKHFRRDLDSITIVEASFISLARPSSKAVLPRRDACYCYRREKRAGDLEIIG